MAVKTFLDSGVLISAWQGDTARQMKALTILSDPQRVFVCSPFVKLELLPKATYFRNQDELKFYHEYFDFVVSEWIDDLPLLYEEGVKVGCRFGLKAMDALQIAAALLASCDEFVTTERPTSPFSRVVGVPVLTIY
ncbi:MAG: PIN domain-containing protein [Acidobacteria bacterium]|nr:PIN domain-containing protein [Acidobacteriota bacterium]